MNLLLHTFYITLSSCFADMFSYNRLRSVPLSRFFQYLPLNLLLLGAAQRFTILPSVITVYQAGRVGDDNYYLNFRLLNRHPCSLHLNRMQLTYEKCTVKLIILLLQQKLKQNATQ